MTFFRVVLGIGICIVAVAILGMFAFPTPQELPVIEGAWCSTVAPTPIPPVNWWAVLAFFAMLIMGNFLIIDGFNTSKSPEDPKKYCPCCGRKLE